MGSLKSKLDHVDNCDKVHRSSVDIDERGIFEKSVYYRRRHLHYVSRSVRNTSRMNFDEVRLGAPLSSRDGIDVKGRAPAPRIQRRVAWNRHIRNDHVYCDITPDEDYSWTICRDEAYASRHRDDRCNFCETFDPNEEFEWNAHDACVVQGDFFIERLQPDIEPGEGIYENDKPEFNVRIELSGEFDPTNFLDRVPRTDTSGSEVPVWKRQLIARQLAEKAFKEHSDMKRITELGSHKETRNISNVPSSACDRPSKPCQR